MKFSLDWLSDFLDVAAAGGTARIRALLEQAGFPVESVGSAGSDTVFDVEITPNRPDAMSHRGLARDLAAMAGLETRGGVALEPPVSGPPAQELTSIVIEVPRLCRRFGARVLRGTSDAPAPERVRTRLLSIGAKSIGAAVDSTNYVLWEIGQPLHAFDLDRLQGGGLIVRRARKGETLVTLDGEKRILETSDIVVADAGRAVSLAGIMGGRDTAVTRETRNVLLEAAWWDPTAIRRTARRLGLHTDASHRFERGADAEAIPEALDRAAQIVLEAAGGTLAPGWIDARGTALKPHRAVLRLSRLQLLAGGGRFDLDFAAAALGRLGFFVERHGRRLKVSVPSWRSDVSIEDDLIEEVLRVYGYDRLPSRLPPTTAGGGHLEPLRETEECLTDGAVAAGFFETMSSPFVDRHGDEKAFASWLSAAGAAASPVSIANPLDEARRDLRATLLPGLLDALARNVHRGERDVALFEVGRVFDRPGHPDDPPSFESRRFAFALAGEIRPHWSVPVQSRQADFFDAKGLLERVLEPWLAPETLQWKPFVSEAFARDAAAVLETVEGVPLGVVGLLSASEREKRKLLDAAFAGELRIDAIPVKMRTVRFRAYSAFPPIEADLSFAHRRETSWNEIEGFVRSLCLGNLESCRIVDRYEGQGVSEEHVKTTLRLTFRSPERTLSQEEVNREVQRLMHELMGELGVLFG